ncbi:MAG TPA: hypothetical protein DDW54_02975, partial [Clostridiales bacterium]|nr:hypothetical protein [Clostridiales bacterium]
SYTTGSDFLKIGKIESTDDENILSLSGITTIPLDNVAADTFYSENAFYVLSTVREQANQACVYKIPLSDGIGTIE